MQRSPRAEPCHLSTFYFGSTQNLFWLNSKFVLAQLKIYFGSTQNLCKYFATTPKTKMLGFNSNSSKFPGVISAKKYYFKKHICSQFSGFPFICFPTTNNKAILVRKELPDFLQKMDNALFWHFFTFSNINQSYLNEK